eukprot:TRINITY_DN59149_c0_g1_i1.p1 TRINITY_DN59149_c0_g1~~TRINITY_DN59149_c0_g1_i1.p1  ORF type:complete len:146 (-),score=9.00 TRINITY_DN59149_c0_g1_i1:16-453(-)
MKDVHVNEDIHDVATCESSSSWVAFAFKHCTSTGVFYHKLAWVREATSVLPKSNRPDAIAWWVERTANRWRLSNSALAAGPTGAIVSEFLEGLGIYGGMSMVAAYRVHYEELRGERCCELRREMRPCLARCCEPRRAWTLSGKLC